MKTTKSLKNNTKLFIISLVALILVSFINWGIVSGFGDVNIQRLTLIGDDGMPYSALFYVPKNVNNQNKAPLALAFHGNSGNARNHESWAVEFTRRGYAFLAIDNFGAGDSEYNAQYDEATKQMVTVARLFTNYVYQLDFIDHDNVISCGHSLGGNTAYNIAKEFNTKTLISSDGRWWMDGSDGSQYHGNYAHITGGSDDKCPQPKMLAAALKSFQTNGYEIEKIEINKLYGSFEKGNAFTYVEIPGQIHEGAFVNKSHIEALLDFAMKSVPAPKYIEPANQIWEYKDFAGLAGMIFFVIAIISYALALIENVPFFSDLSRPLPRNIGLRKTGMAISIICGLVFPYFVLRTGCFGLVKAIGGTGSSVPANFKLFPFHFAGIAMSVVLGCALLGCITLILFILIDGKKNKATLSDFGLTLENSNSISLLWIAKSLLLALIVVGSGFIYLRLQGEYLGTDFYCQFFGFKPIPAIKAAKYVPYIIVWMFSFVIASLGMNIERRLPSTGNNTKDTAIAVIFNAFITAFTVTLILCLQNSKQVAANGASTIWGDWGLDLTRLWGMPVGMALGAGGQTYLFRKTGNVWLGAFTMGTICALACVLYGQLRYGIVVK